MNLISETAQIQVHANRNAQRNFIGTYCSFEQRIFSSEYKSSVKIIIICEEGVLNLLFMLQIHLFTKTSKVLIFYNPESAPKRRIMQF